MYNIFLPVETIARELDYRLLLAAKVLNKERRVFICNHRHLNKIMHHFRGGIYIGKHIFQSLMPVENWAQYKKVKQLGIDVIYIPEEGAIYKGGEEDWKKVLELQYDPTGFDANDRLCVWGEWQKSIYAEQNLEVPVHVTGHPRFDLCKEGYRDFYKEQVDRLREKYKNFILVNSNYSSANYGLGIGHLFSRRMGYDPRNSDKRQQFVDFYAHTTKSMVDMISLVHRLSTEFPEKNLIYRSHPSEGDDLYKAIFKGLENVKFVHEGSIGPWLLAAETIIHDGCTTAIEASFSDALVINYKTIENEALDIRLPNLVGTKATTPEAVIEAIRKGVPDSITGAAFDELNFMIANYASDSFESLSRVIEDKIGSINKEACRAPGTSKLKYEYTRSSLSKKWKRATSNKRRKSGAYAEKKFPGFDLRAIQDRVNHAAQIMDTDMKLAYADPLMLILEQGK